MSFEDRIRDRENAMNHILSVLAPSVREFVQQETLEDALHMLLATGDEGLDLGSSIDEYVIATRKHQHSGNVMEDERYRAVFDIYHMLLEELPRAGLHHAPASSSQDSGALKYDPLLI